MGLEFEAQIEKFKQGLEFEARLKNRSQIEKFKQGLERVSHATDNDRF